MANYYSRPAGPQMTCQGGKWQRTITNLVGAGEIISVGFRNEGFADYFWAPQMFIFPGGKRALWQVMNGSRRNVQWWPFAVINLSAPAGPDEVLLEPAAEAEEGDLPVGFRWPPGGAGSRPGTRTSFG